MTWKRRIGFSARWNMKIGCSEEHGSHSEVWKYFAQSGNKISKA